MNELAAAYDEGLRDGRLLIQFCHKCERANMYPRFRCPFCFGSELGWRPASGRGVLYSFTVQYLGAPTQYADQLPYALGVVRLEEGVQLLARLVPDESGGWSSYRCDLPVRFCSPPQAPSPSVRPAPWFCPAVAD